MIQNEAPRKAAGRRRDRRRAWPELGIRIARRTVRNYREELNIAEFTLSGKRK
ncbi:MAG: hypothetical protein MZV63_33635 [Marinilabiliales bacterium]|nr:hypothetical protein [Marinilabiliales bacterium]